MKRNLIVTTAIAALMSAPAFAQSGDMGAEDAHTSAQAQGSDQQDAPIIALTDWNYDEIYQHGWSLTQLLDAEVVGDSGEEIGDVENVLIGQDGNILSVIAEVGGFLDIGDTHVAVPFEEVTLGASLDKITVPLDQDNVEDYSVFGEWGYFDLSEADVQQVVNDDLLTGPRVWKASELLDDYAILTGGIGYGYVDDLIFVEGGRLHAVIVDPAVGYGPGPYAYPYYGYAYGWHPGASFYDLGYTEDEIAVIDTFDPDRMQGAMATGSVETDAMDDTQTGSDANAAGSGDGTTEAGAAENGQSADQ